MLCPILQETTTSQRTFQLRDIRSLIPEVSVRQVIKRIRELKMVRSDFDTGRSRDTIDVEESDTQVVAYSVITSRGRGRR